MSKGKRHGRRRRANSRGVRIEKLTDVWREGRRERVIVVARTRPDAERKRLAWYLVNFGGAAFDEVQEIWPIKDRYECTAAAPYDRAEHGGRAYHPDAVEVGEQENGWPGGDLVTWQCPHCHTSWKSELPQ